MCFKTILVVSQPRSNITRRLQRNPANLRPSSTPLSFSMALWNCPSAANKADFISAFSLQSTLSILGLTETWIRPEDSDALSNNFSFSHTPCQVGRGGGTGLLISNHWKYSTHSEVTSHLHTPPLLKLPSSPSVPSLRRKYPNLSSPASYNMSSRPYPLAPSPSYLSVTLTSTHAHHQHTSPHRHLPNAFKQARVTQTLSGKIKCFVNTGPELHLPLVDQNFMHFVFFFTTDNLRWVFFLISAVQSFVQLRVYSVCV